MELEKGGHLIRRIQEDPQIASDIGDRASLDHERAVEAAIASIRWQSQREDQIAESRRAKGKYGICEDCGKEISPERLLAKPNAVRCISCQQKKLELKH